MQSRATQALLASMLLAATAASAQDAAPKALIAIVGDADQFNIGQNGFCGKRNEIEFPAGAKFKIPANAQTYFFVRAKFRTPSVTYKCEGEYSFMPKPALLYVIRYTVLGEQCRLEVFQSVPGETPESAPFAQEQPRSCLGQ